LSGKENGEGIGLENSKRGVDPERMRERAKISGGRFQIKPIIGQGDDNPGDLELFLIPNSGDLLSWQII
jgi:hypothetical protein